MKRDFVHLEPEYKIRKLFHIGDSMTEELYFINTRRNEYTITYISGMDTLSETLVSIYSKCGWDPHREKIYFTTDSSDKNILNFEDVSLKPKKVESYFIYISSGIILSISFLYFFKF